MNQEQTSEERKMV